MASRVITVEVADPGCALVNANHREHWRPRARRIAQWRNSAYLAARQARVPLLDGCTVQVAVHLGYRARLDDATNVAPTSKACIDGIVQAGLLIDDSDAYIHEVTFMPTQRTPRTGPKDKPRTRLVITFTETAALDGALKASAS